MHADAGIHLSGVQGGNRRQGGMRLSLRAAMRATGKAPVLGQLLHAHQRCSRPIEINGMAMEFVPSVVGSSADCAPLT